jgi:hypothetical protein
LDRIVPILFYGLQLAAPIFLAWGWLRWWRVRAPRTKSSVVSLAAYALGTCSYLFLVGTLLYGHAVGGFSYYDPVLMAIYRCGAATSAAGFLLSLCGVWRKHTLRWFAPTISFYMLAVWVIYANGE